mgnify:FL=1
MEINSNKKQDSQLNHSTEKSILLGIDECIKHLFPDNIGRPSRRTFDEWRAKGFYRSIKIGRRIFLDTVAVRRDLAKRFTINAID